MVDGGSAVTDSDEGVGFISGIFLNLLFFAQTINAESLPNSATHRSTLGAPMPAFFCSHSVWPFDPCDRNGVAVLFAAAAACGGASGRRCKVSA